MPSDASKSRQETALRLRAEDAEDMAVIAACLQDAVVLQGDMAYLPKLRRFALVVSRYCWEDDPPSGDARGGRPLGRGRRVRTGLHFDGVLKVDTLGLDRHDAAQALALLTIVAEPSADAGAALLLMFAGGPIVRLTVECIDCHLADVGPSWETPRQPRHPVDEAPSGGST
jgi:hypothetical protein